MMTIEIKRLKASIAVALEEAGWTIEKLALATIKELTPISGIGQYTAQYIITQAQEIVNAEGRTYSAVADKKVLKVSPVRDFEPEPVGILPPMSERIRRITRTL